MNILSLFDGISCGQQAINNLGIKDYSYYSSEIDKYAIQVTQANFPNTIQIGDVTKIKYINGSLYSGYATEEEFEKYGVNYNKTYYIKIDILLGGSPCQGFSFAGKQLAFDDPRSKLFFEYVRILKEVKPKYFLLENVKMKKEFQDIISEQLFGIQPVIINSSLLTAQNRKRLYWVGELQEDGSYKQVKIEQPQDKGILLKDILESEVDEKYNISEKHTEAMLRCRSSGKLNTPDIEGKCGTLIASYYKIPQDGPYIHQPKIVATQIGQSKNFGNSWGSEKGYTIKTNTGHGCIDLETMKIRKLTPTECERLQGVKDGYTSMVSNSQRYKMLGNGWTVPVIEHILKTILFPK